MSEILKVGTLVMVIVGRNAGKIGTVVGNDPSHRRLTHEIEFPEPITSFVGGYLEQPTQSNRAWAERSWIIPITPPGEPETLIKEVPAAVKRPVHGGYPGVPA